LHLDAWPLEIQRWEAFRESILSEGSAFTTAPRVTATATRMAAARSSLNSVTFPAASMLASRITTSSEGLGWKSRPSNVRSIEMRAVTAAASASLLMPKKTAGRRGQIDREIGELVAQFVSIFFKIAQVLAGCLDSRRALEQRVLKLLAETCGFALDIIPRFQCVFGGIEKLIRNIDRRDLEFAATRLVAAGIQNGNDDCVRRERSVDRAPARIDDDARVIGSLAGKQLNSSGHCFRPESN
jgi:hypothetical protein